jgi:hypothetical protein
MGRGVMNRIIRERHREPRSGIVDSLGQVEKSSAFRAVFMVASERQMTALQISLECNNYNCTEPKPLKQGQTNLQGKIFLGKEERAVVEVDVGSGDDLSRREGFKITTSDPLIKRIVKETGGTFQEHS